MQIVIHNIMRHTGRAERMTNTKNVQRTNGVMATLRGFNAGFGQIEHSSSKMVWNARMVLSTAKIGQTIGITRDNETGNLIKRHDTLIDLANKQMNINFRKKTHDK